MPDPVPGEGREIWLDEAVMTDRPQGYVASENSYPILNKPVAFVPKSRAVEAEKHLGACLAVMRAAVEVYERGEGNVQDRMARLLLVMLDVLGPAHSAYPPSVEQAVLRFGLKENEGRRA